MNLNIQAQNMPGLVRQSEQFNKNMQQGAAAPGGTSGSRGVAMKAEYMAARSENQSYNRGRGVGEASTGSATSDFARQATGLGGLVHVYATFAANIFAVSAAFNALSKSMDTANLVAGLDQIGAASGKNLGSVAKQMVAVADGAISLRDAMSSTAMASAGGISNANIIRMTEVAKKASLALGRDLPDSMDRITKGIVKIQPELLDELGIMTRVIPAQQQYAREMGKTVASLSDFEKRQAFANAVLAEGEKKFGSISLQANPYSKLLASTTNLLQGGLEVINKVLSPLISLLGSSPTGLALAIAGIGTMLLKQAIPALGAWRESLNAAALDAEKTANRINSNFIDFDIERKMGPAQALAAAATKEANMAISNVQTSLSKAFSSNSKIVKAATSGTYDSAVMQSSISRQEKSAVTKLKNLEEARRITTNTDAAHLAALDAGIIKQKQQLDLLKAASAQNIIAGQKMASGEAILEEARIGADKAPFPSEAWNREQIAKRAANKAQSLRVLSNVGTNTETMGAAGAFSALFQDINKGPEKFDEAGKSMGRMGGAVTGLTKYTTLASGSFRILTNTIGTTLNAFAPWLMVIGLVTGGLSLLNDYMSNNAKEADKYKESIENLKSSLDNVDRTIANIATKDPLERLSIASTEATATAFKELSDNITSATNSFIAMQEKAGGFERFKEGFKEIFGYGVSNDMAASLATSVSKTLDLVGKGSEAEEFKTKLAGILGTDKFDLKSIQNAFNSLTDAGKTKLLKDFAKAEEETSNKANIAASDLVSLKEALNTTAKASQELTNSFNANDPAAKLGISLIAVSGALQKVTASGKDSQKALLDLLENTEALSAMGTEYATKLVMLKQEFKDNSASVEQYTTAIEGAKEAYREFIATKSEERTSANIETPLGGFKFGPQSKLADAQADKGYDLQENIRLLNKASNAQAASYQEKQKSLQMTAQKVLTEGMQASFVKGADLIDKSLGIGAQKVGASIAKGYSAGLSGVQALNQQKLITEKEVSIQLQLIEVNSEQILATNRLSTTMEGLALIEKLALETAKPAKDQNATLIAQLNKAVATNAGVSGALSGSSAQVSKNVTQVVKASRGKGMEPDSITAGIGRELQGQYASQQGIKAQRAAATAALAELNISQQYAKVVAQYTETTQAKLNHEKDMLGVQLSSLANADKLTGYVTEASLAAKQQLERQIQQKDVSSAEGLIKAQILGIETQLTNKMGDKQRDILVAQKTQLENNLQKSQELNTQKNINTVATQEIDLLLLKQQNLREINELKDVPIRVAAESGFDITKDEITLQKSKLDIDHSRGRLSEDYYKTEAARLDLITLETEAKKAQYLLDSQHLTKMAKLNDDLENAKKGGDTTKAVAAIAAEEATYKAATAGAERLTQAKYADIVATTAQTEAQEAFEDSVHSMAGTLTDAMREATESGKYDFTSMIEKMIQDMAWAEIKISTMNFGKDIAKGMGITSMFGAEGGLFGSGGLGLFGGGGPEQLSGPGMGESGGGLLSTIMSLFAADGAAFDQGVRKFAKGGTFTNEVVNSPTVFKFAKGTGLMGEAGPEAIMPLKRGPNGSLGVVSNGGQQANSQVEKTVVVNNNFTISGSTDQRTQMQIAEAAARGARTALARNG